MDLMRDPIIEVITDSRQRRVVLSAAYVYDRLRAFFQIPAEVLGGSPHVPCSFHLTFKHLFQYFHRSLSPKAVHSPDNT